MTVAQAFQQLTAALSTQYDAGEAHSIARIVFEDAFHIRNLKRRDRLSSSQLAQLSRIQSRLLNNEPVQYITGRTYFYGLNFKVDKRALIPRQETEELVHWILEDHPKKEKVLRVLDIGTGTGCIPITLKVKRPQWEVHALDISPQALALARENARENMVDLTFHEADILDRSQWPELPLFDLIVSNPPYIPPSEAHLVPENVQAYEPHKALFTGEEEPLVFYERILDFALEYLKPGGRLYFEANEYRAADVRDLMREKGMKRVELRRDIGGRDRMLKGELGAGF